MCTELQVMTQLEKLDMSDCMRLEALPATLGLLTLKPEPLKPIETLCWTRCGGR